MKKIVDKKDALEVVLDGHDLGEASMVVEKLNKRGNLSFAAASYTHPLKGEPVLYAKGKGVDKEVHAAIQEAREDVKEFKEKLEKASKA